jgi:hypothetical protein
MANSATRYPITDVYLGAMKQPGSTALKLKVHSVRWDSGLTVSPVSGDAIEMRPFAGGFVGEAKIGPRGGKQRVTLSADAVRPAALMRLYEISIPPSADLWATSFPHPDTSGPGMVEVYAHFIPVTGVRFYGRSETDIVRLDYCPYLSAGRIDRSHALFGTQVPLGWRATSSLDTFDSQDLGSVELACSTPPQPNALLNSL